MNPAAGDSGLSDDHEIAGCDLLVIGSGPAGLAAALTARTAGADVLVLSPRFPARAAVLCWESFHPGVEVLLDRLNATETLRRSALACFSRVRSDGIERSLGQHPALAWSGWHVDRLQFDLELASLARARGVRFMEGAAMPHLLLQDGRVAGIGLRPGGSVRAGWTIDASGSRHILSGAAGFVRRRNRTSFPVWSGLIPGDALGYPASDTVYATLDDGWLWLTSMVGGLRGWTGMLFARERPKGALDELRRASVPGSLIAAAGRWQVFRPLVRPGLLLAGDAAGMLDPSWGQGVLNALYSGRAAAHAIVSAAADANAEMLALAAYDQWFVDRHERSAVELSRLVASNGKLRPSSASG